MIVFRGFEWFAHVNLRTGNHLLTVATFVDLCKECKEIESA